VFIAVYDMQHRFSSVGTSPIRCSFARTFGFQLDKGDWISRTVDSIVVVLIMAGILNHFVRVSVAEIRYRWKSFAAHRQ
jgi:hypothetical protein